MKIKNIKKFIRFIFVTILMIFAIIMLINNVTLSHKEIEYKVIYVSQGDTLWDIAKSNQKFNEYYKNKDIRYIVDNLKEINNLKNSNININQKLLIPTI